MGAVRIRVAVLAVLTAIGCRGEQVLVAVAPAGDRYEWREQVQFASVGREAAALRVDVDRPVGYAEARQRPLSAFGISARIRWNATVEKLCRLYGQLCTDHNSALISVQEFKDGRAELDSVTAALAGIRTGFLRAVTDCEEAEALLARDVTPAERPPGVSPAAALALRDESRARATAALQAAAEAVGRLDATRPPKVAATPAPEP